MSEATHPQGTLVSVLITSFNYGRYLGEAIESALAQTYSEVEVVVVDDGSTDDTAEVARSFGERIRFVQQPNRGVCAAKNRAVSEARGEYCVLVDGDDRVHPEFCARTLDALLAADPATVGFAYTQRVFFGDGQDGQPSRFPPYDVGELKQRNYILSTSLVKRELLLRFPLDLAFREALSDYDFYLSLAESGVRGVLVDMPLVEVRRHGSSITSRTARPSVRLRLYRQLMAKHAAIYAKADVAGMLLRWRHATRCYALQRAEAGASRIELLADAWWLVRARAPVLEIIRQLRLATACTRTLDTLVAERSPFAGLPRRLGDWFAFMTRGILHRACLQQTKYLVGPRRFLATCSDPADIFFLFRDTVARREMIRHLRAGRPSGLAAGQLFGFSELLEGDLRMDCNLTFPRFGGRIRFLDRYADVPWDRHAGRGDIESLWAHLPLLNRSRVVVCTSDNTALPALRLKAQGVLVPALVYVSIGLPERVAALSLDDPGAADVLRRRVSQFASCVVAYGHAEAEWLRDWLGPEADVRFVPFGVDTQAWRPMAISTSIDVLSIGADRMRDFGLLLAYAQKHPDTDVCLVAGREWADEIGAPPANVRLLVDQSPEAVRELIASAQLLVLPVRENSYSGATTTLLQSMAMGKAVAVSKVGAIAEGYGFVDGVNLCWMVPGEQDSFDATVERLRSDAGLRRQLGEAARELVVSQLDWYRYVRRMRGIAMSHMVGSDRAEAEMSN